MARADQTPTPVATLAARLFARRQARAWAAVQAGTMRLAEAERHMAPWAAIACRLGADLSDLVPGMAEAIADRRVVQVSADGTGPSISDAHARALVADDVCPRWVWAPLLAKARDHALAAPVSAGSKGDEARAEAVELLRIAEHFGHDINGRHPVPPPDPALLGLNPAPRTLQQGARA